MVDLQERNGSWWDYPFYAYHQPYGTAMAIMTLRHCQQPAASDARQLTKSHQSGRTDKSEKSDGSP
jgi:hypothetical protein